MRRSLFQCVSIPSSASGQERRDRFVCLRGEPDFEASYHIEQKTLNVASTDAGVLYEVWFLRAAEGRNAASCAGRYAPLP
jgi:hypothetical protein